MQLVAPAVEWFWTILVFAFLIIFNGAEVGQSSHESTEVYLVFSAEKLWYVIKYVPIMIFYYT